MKKHNYGFAGRVAATFMDSKLTPLVIIAALRLMQVGYANGVMPLTDVLQSLAALTKASANNEGALSALRQALVELDYAMGRLAADG